MAKVRKRKLPSGKAVWLVDYRDGEGKRRFKQFDKKAQAEAWLIKIGRDLQLGLHVADAASITVKEAAKLWLERCGDAGLERSTQDRNRQHVDLHIVPFLGTKKLSQVTTPTVHAFANELVKHERSAAMVKGVLVSLGSIFREAQRRGLANMNPVADARVKVNADRRKSSRPLIPTKPELKAILDHASGKHRALIVTALFSGLRASEVRGLRWCDIDLKRAIVSVNGRVDAWGNFGPCKSSAGYRDVPLAPYAVNVLKEHKLASKAVEDGFLFGTSEGTVMSHQNMVNRIWNPLQIAAGLFCVHESRVEEEEGKSVKVARYNFHCLRHAAASLFIESGMTPKRVQAVMGHSTITLTFDRYGHLFEDADADKAAVAAIEATLLR